MDLATAPLFQVTAMSASDFFTYGMRLLAFHPPHLSDWSLIEQMRRIGLVPNRSSVASMPMFARRSKAYPKRRNTPWRRRSRAWPTS